MNQDFYLGAGTMAFGFAIAFGLSKLFGPEVNIAFFLGPGVMFYLLGHKKR